MKQVHNSKNTKQDIINSIKSTIAVFEKSGSKKQLEENKNFFDYWLDKNKYYHSRIKEFYRFVIPKDAAVLHLNCKNGYLLDAVKPSVGIGIDSDKNSLDTAQKRYPDYLFYTTLAQVPRGQTFDYIVLSSITMETEDIQELFLKLAQFCHAQTRILVDSYSYFWEPVLWLTQKLGLRRPTIFKNWLSQRDIKELLYLAGFEVTQSGGYMLLPMHIPGISTFFNTWLAALPGIHRLCLNQWVKARLLPVHQPNKTVSVVIPCRNEKGNIEAAVKRVPTMGKHTEIIFVEGNSKDNTLEEIERVMQAYPDKDIKCFVQDGKGKGDAVRKGFAHASGDMLMILDADLTVQPEELPKFFNALSSGKGDFINGSRLVYGMESEAMRFLNLLANFFFSVLFSWILDYRVKDTLCGTKVLWKKDYEKIVKNRSFFGDFDPFGDFDLLFGAAKQNLKIIDMPVHYKSRTYGTTQIRRFYHGLILLRMSLVGFRKFKLR